MSATPRSPQQRVTVEVEMREPDLVASAFYLIHTLAKAHELDDVEGVSVAMTLTFGGWPYPSQVDAFKERIKQMWLDARVTEVQTLETPTKEKFGEPVE